MLEKKLKNREENPGYTVRDSSLNLEKKEKAFELLFKFSQKRIKISFP